jgi:uncharacterized protein (TIGR02001 family)
MVGFFRALLIGTLCCVGQAVVADDGGGRSVGMTLAATSDYVLRGISQSYGDAAFQADVHFYAPVGGNGSAIIAGLWGSTVRPLPQHDLTVELDPYIGYLWNIDQAWSGKLTLVHYSYPWAQYASHRQYDEVALTAGWRDRLSIGVAVAPDVDRYRNQRWTSGNMLVSYDAAWRIPIAAGWSSGLSAGYYDLQGAAWPGYWYWSADVSYSYESMRVDVGYFGTDQTAKRLYRATDLANDRFATTVSWRF